MSQAQADVRPSPLAGRWYPADAARLAASVDGFLAAAEPPDLWGELIALLAPHAGHRYSGPVAGRAYRAVQGAEFESVAVVGPSHYPYAVPVLTTAHDAYATPLGRVPVDRAALDRLGAAVPVATVRRDAEHSLEIELPFLQRALVGGFGLLPLMLVEQSLALAESLGAALAEVLRGRRALLVASSDLSHFYPQRTAEALDRAMLDAVAAFDPAAVIAAEESGRGFACGRGALAAVMIAARALGADRAQVVGYATSGDVTGDTEQVVGYGAALFFRAATQ